MGCYVLCGIVDVSDLAEHESAIAHYTNLNRPCCAADQSDLSLVQRHPHQCVLPTSPLSQSRVGSGDETRAQCCCLHPMCYEQPTIHHSQLLLNFFFPRFTGIERNSWWRWWAWTGWKEGRSRRPGTPGRGRRSRKKGIRKRIRTIFLEAVDPN